jgi:hypothetical protein
MLVRNSFDDLLAIVSGPSNNDPFVLLSSFGDPVERHFIGRIQQVLPSYARIWAEYVGNDGHANQLPMPGASEQALRSRTECWQCLYTVFESLALCWHIEEELTHIEQIKDFKSYAQNLNLWMAFYSYLGRIHDMIKVIVERGDVNRPDLLRPFNQFWKERHIILHGPKVPLRWVENVLGVPPLGGVSRSWNDKMNWDELGKVEFEFLATTVSSSLRELEARLDRCLAELCKILPVIYDWKPIVWPMINAPGQSQVSYPSSSAYDAIPMTWPSGSQ